MPGNITVLHGRRYSDSELFEVLATECRRPSFSVRRSAMSDILIIEIMKKLTSAVAYVNRNSYFCNAYQTDRSFCLAGRGQCPVSYAGYFYSLMLQPITAAFPQIYALARDCVSLISNGTAAVSLSASLIKLTHMKALTLTATSRAESPLRVMTGISLVPQPLTAAQTARRIVRAALRGVTLERALVAVAALGMMTAMLGVMALADSPSRGAAVMAADGALASIAATLLYFRLIVNRAAQKGGRA